MRMAGSGVQFGRPVMHLAMELYAGLIWSRTCQAPAHHLSDPHSIAGSATVQARCARAPGESSFFVVIRHKLPVERHVEAGTFAA